MPVCDVELERCLTGMRAILLGTAADGPAEPAEDGLLRFFCALARQGFINEYVFDATAEELEQVRLMRERIARAVSSGGTVPVLWLIAVAAYLPLHSLPGVETLLDRVWSPAVAALLTQQVREPQHERSLRTSIPALTAIADEVSRKVQDQYEDNPYPRWVKPAPKGAAKTIAQYFGSWLQPAGTDQQDAVDILVAGCGTGQNLVETAQQLEGARVLAVDLSMASLCYAKRHALALGLTNIDFAQADILGLAGLGRSFDIVDASGVLHHMSDPWAAWQLLLSLLRPGGFMRVGLYSKLARSGINAMRAFVAERGYRATPEDIRASRQVILQSDREWAKSIGTISRFFHHQRMPRHALPCAGAADGVARDWPLPGREQRPIPRLRDRRRRAQKISGAVSRKNTP